MPISSGRLAVLIHGFTRGAVDMQFWKSCLASDFPDILTPDLPTTYGSFEDCVATLDRFLADAGIDRYREVFIAGHSMGGLIAREYLKRRKPGNVRYLVCAGTPHFGSRLADIALLLPGAGLIWQPLHALKCSARKQLTTPDIPGLKIGVIVSKNNGHWPGKLFLSRDSDGLVESFSADAPDASDSIQTRAAHIKMQFDAETAGMIRDFFINGSFSKETD